ncbi:MAG: spheroidene monooxygenase [Pseudomonadota bacterium]
MTNDAQITSLSVFRFDGLGGRAWAFSQMLLARRAMARLPEVGFWKLFGSGTGEGFTPVPNTAVYGVLATWPSRKAAEIGLRAAVFQRYRDRASEDWTIMMRTTASRGRWDGKAPFEASGRSNGPLAALTRATLRPRTMMKFWQRVPSISAAIGSDTNVAFKIGLGEVPWLHQVTFSIWPDPSSMAEFARRDGPHARAIQAVREGQWFAEELYARFDIVGSSGSWNGGDPLKTLKRPEPA